MSAEMESEDKLIDRLMEERDLLRRQVEVLIGIIRRLYKSMEETRYPHPDAPGHCHDTPGRWDKDGSVCARCKAWADLKDVLRNGPHPRFGKGGGGE